MEWHPVFRAGRTRLQVSFTGGHLCGGACTAAAYETSDPVVQAVIETSEAFRSGRITLAAGCIGAAAVIMAAPNGRMNSLRDGKGGSQEPATVMEFGDLDSASDFLQGRKGIPVDRVLSREQCEAEARDLGIRLIIKNDVKA